MFQAADTAMLSGIENFNSNPDLLDQDLLDTFKNQVAILHKGFIVHVTDCKACRDTSNYVIMEVTLCSTINSMPVFGDVKLKITKQSAQKFKRLLDIKDPFAEESVVSSKKHKY